jgi:hypothetical protein
MVAQGGDVMAILRKYRKDMEAILTVSKLATVFAILLGGWGLFQYCHEVGIPFPAEIPTLIATVGVAGIWLSLVGSGFLLFPLLSKTGGLGEKYAWLMSLSDEENGKLKGKLKGKAKLAGFVLVPVLAFEVAFLWSLILNDKYETYLNWGILVYVLVSIGYTAINYFKQEERFAAAGSALILMLILMAWLVLVLLIIISVLSPFIASINREYEVAILVIIQVPLFMFLYVAMLPRDSNASEARKEWGQLVFVVFVFLMIYPYPSARITERTLHTLKLGGGFKTSYTLVETYCKGTQNVICGKNGNQAVDLELMLNSGDRVYVRMAGSTIDKENDQTSDIYMLPQRMIVAERLNVGKGNRKTDEQ